MIQTLNSLIDLKVLHAGDERVLIIATEFFDPHPVSASVLDRKQTLELLNALTDIVRSNDPDTQQ